MRINLLAVMVVFASVAAAQQPQQRRIVRAVDNRSVVRLSGTVNPRIRGAVDRGAVSPTLQLHRMRMVFAPSSEQQAALDKLLEEQQDPNSVNYHHWLTPEEYADRFGLAQADLAVVSAWLNSQGFTIEEISRARNWIAFSGIAAQVEAAFHAPLHSYVVNGVQHYAPSTDISVPDAFQGVVSGVAGLHDFAPRPLNVKPKSHITSSITGNHFMAPGDFATIYNLPSYSNGVPCTSPCSNDGTGQTIAVVGQTELSTDSNTGRNGTPGQNGQQYDLVTFRNLAGLPPVNLTIKVKGTDPGIVSGDVDEANLDLEWAGAAAPNAALLYYIESPNNGGGGAFAALVDAVNDNQAKIISVSYGTCEAQVDNNTYNMLNSAGQQASTQGQAIVVAAGDSGAADCDTNIPATGGISVDFPGSMPYSTSIGGTTFTGDSTNTTDPTQPTQYWAGATNDASPSAFSYIPETSWNDSSGLTSCTNCISATGGGASVKYTKPSWQVGPGVPADNARDTPDVSFAAAPSPDGYVICSQSSCVNGYRAADTTYNVIGGTSAGTPVFSGILAVINQVIGSPQGNINSKLYAMVQTYPLPGNSNTSWVYNDITSGDNKVVCSGGNGCNGGTLGYSAGSGYDRVTGLGTLDVTALVDAMNNSPNPHFLVLPVSRSQSIDTGASTTVGLSVTPKEGFTGNVALTCALSSSLSGATCSYDNSTVSAPGTANLTIGSGTITGAETGTVTLTGTSGNLTNSVAINLSVGVAPDFTLTVASPVISIPSGTALTDNISIASVGGFSSDVTVTCSVPSSLGATTCLFSNGQSSTVITGGNGSALATITGAVLSRDLGAPLPFNHRGLGTLAAFPFAVGIFFAARATRCSPGESVGGSNEQRGRPARRLTQILLGFLALFLILGAVSCGGGSNNGGGGGNTPNPITGNLTITATGGGITHTTTINVTVY